MIHPFHPYFVADHVPFPAVDLVLEHRVVRVEPQHIAALIEAADEALPLIEDTSLYGFGSYNYFARDAREVLDALRAALAPFVPQAGPSQPATRPEPAGSTAGGPMEHRPESGGDACDVRGCGGQPVYLYSVGVPAPTYPLFLCVHHANELALCGIGMKPVRRVTSPLQHRPEALS